MQQLRPPPAHGGRTARRSPSTTSSPAPDHRPLGQPTSSRGSGRRRARTPDVDERGDALGQRAAPGSPPSAHARPARTAGGPSASTLQIRSPYAARLTSATWMWIQRRIPTTASPTASPVASRRARRRPRRSPTLARRAAADRASGGDGRQSRRQVAGIHGRRLDLDHDLGGGRRPQADAHEARARPGRRSRSLRRHRSGLSVPRARIVIGPPRAPPNRARVRKTHCAEEQGVLTSMRGPVISRRAARPRRGDAYREGGSYGQHGACARRISQSILDRDAAGVRGLGGDVPVLRAVRRAAARDRREPLLVLELDAFPGADAGVRRDLHRLALPGGRRVAEPGVRGAAGDGDRLPRRQRLHLHLGQPGHRPGEDRRARRVLPEARRLLLRELDRAVRQVAGEDGGADRRARRAARARPARVRARRGRVRATTATPRSTRCSTPTAGRCGSAT